MPTTIHWDLNTDSTLGGNNPSDQEIASQKAIKTYTDNGLADKQDVLTAGTNMSIVDVPAQSVDTRSTATVQTVSSTSRTWQEVCYGNGKWVAVGNDGYMCVSTDGTTWGTPFTVGTRKWRGIIYANNQFIACGEYGNVGVSSDGTNWATQTVGNSTSSFNWYDIIFINNSYIMVSDVGGFIATTSDLTSWTVTSKGATSKRCIAYGNNMYVCLGGGYVSLSEDGINWTTQNVSVNADGIIYIFNKFIAVGGSGRISTSTNGTTWTTQTVGSDAWQEIRYANGILVISGNSGYTSTSTDGETWTTPLQIGTISWYGLGNNGNDFVAVGTSGGMTSFQVGQTEGGTVISAIVDSALSSTSENPVQNKVIYNAIGDIETILHNLNSGSGVQ